MDFTAAFKYPFNNAAKVLTIVLAMTIAFALCLALIVNAYDWNGLAEDVNSMIVTGVEMSEEHPSGDVLERVFAGVSAATLGLLGLIAVSIVGGFWFSGYSVDVVRSIMAGDDVMPAIDFGRSLRQGFVLFLSAILYALLFCVYLAVVALLAALLGNLGGLIVIVAVIAAIPILFLMGWGYYIGMARYADTEDSGAVFQIMQNMKTARVNLGVSVALVFWQIVLTAIYNIASRLVNGVLDGIVGSGILLTGLVISMIVVFALNMFQHFSAQHLIAQYAMQIGIDEQEPPKKKG